MYRVNYVCFRLIAILFQYLPYRALHFLGVQLGSLLYYTYPKYRKRALSNIALATSFHLTPREIRALAKKSLQNLAITALEYPKLFKDQQLSIATCENPQVITSLIEQGKGVIFFCGHQANWEILFLKATQTMSGVAIGKPIKNPFIYEWVLRLRQKFQGIIIPPKQAYKSSIKALKEGKFLGIVGDQGMPASSFSSLFLGRKAYTSHLPALLSHRTSSPVVVATIKRENNHYFIHYSDPVYPQNDPVSQMQTVLSLFEQSVLQRPHEWLWIHNRWKGKKAKYLPKSCQHDSILVIFAEHSDIQFWSDKICQMYAEEHITLFVPKMHLFTSSYAEVIPYENRKDLFQEDYRFKLLIDFTGTKGLKRFYKKLAVQNAFFFKTPKDFLDYAYSPIFSS